MDVILFGEKWTVAIDVGAENRKIESLMWGCDEYMW